MCRYGDDAEWYVDATFREVNDVERKCEDCERTIAIGEELIRYTTIPGDSEWDERPYVYAAYDLTGKVGFNGQPRRYAFETDPYFAVVGDDNGDDNGDDSADLQQRIDAFEALGFVVDEVRDPRIPVTPMPDHYTCVQCVAGAHWLLKVCDQHHVLVTRYDLLEHLDEYDAETLGPDFMALTDLARGQWRDALGTLTPEAVVKNLAEAAATHAVAVGLTDH